MLDLVESSHSVTFDSACHRAFDSMMLWLLHLSVSEDVILPSGTLSKSPRLVRLGCLHETMQKRLNLLPTASHQQHHIQVMSGVSLWRGRSTCLAVSSAFTKFGIR